MVVVEPALIHREVNGARLLYVAMTRAVQHLSLVHTLALPRGAHSGVSRHRARRDATA